MQKPDSGRAARVGARSRIGLVGAIIAISIACFAHSHDGPERADDDRRVEALDFGRPCTDPQPAVDEKNPVDRLSRKAPRSDPAAPLTPAPYPTAARMMGMEGVVVVSLLINEEGQVSRAEVKKSARFPVLDAAALEGTRNWRLRPGTVQGKAVCMWGNFALTFKLEDYSNDELAKASVTPQTERLATLLLGAEQFENLMFRDHDLTAEEHAIVASASKAFLAHGDWLQTRRRVAAILATELTPTEIDELVKFQESAVAGKLRTLQDKLIPSISIEERIAAMAFVCTTAQINFALKDEDSSKVFAGEQLTGKYARRVPEYAAHATSYCFCRARWEDAAARGLVTQSAPRCEEAPPLHSE